jgi:hypothetical protein
MYHDDEEDLYTPHIRLAAMPSPRSKYAPYFSGRADELEDFLEEFEGRAFNRKLTDPQRVDAFPRYVDLSSRVLCNGSRSRDWPRFW